MENQVTQYLWFKTQEVPRNLLGRIPKKKRPYYRTDGVDYYVAKEVGFLFTQYAWFFAFDHLEVDPDKFEQMDEYKQHIALCYGAAKYWCMKNQKQVFFTMDELEGALKENTLRKNEEIVEARRAAVFDHWMEIFMERGEDGPVKKKSQKTTS
jgi:hypothetical protein